MQLHYIWYYKILIKTSSCYPLWTVLYIYIFLLACAFLSKKKKKLFFFFFFTSWLKPKPVICVHWWPTFGRDMINIATCCEGFAMAIPPCGSPSFRWLLLLGCCLSFMGTLRFCSSELGLQPKLCLVQNCLLNAATWPHTTYQKYTSHKCEFKGDSGDGCSIRYPNGIVGSKLISHGELWDEQSVTLDKGLSD